MEEIFKEAQLLKEDPQLIKRVMGAMRKKFDLCLRRDGGTCGGVSRHLRNEHFVNFTLQLLCICVTFQKMSEINCK